MRNTPLEERCGPPEAGDERSRSLLLTRGPESEGRIVAFGFEICTSSGRDLYIVPPSQKKPLHSGAFGKPT